MSLGFAVVNLNTRSVCQNKAFPFLDVLGTDRGCLRTASEFSSFSSMVLFRVCTCVLVPVFFVELEIWPNILLALLVLSIVDLTSRMMLLQFGGIMCPNGSATQSFWFRAWLRRITCTNSLRSFTRALFPQVVSSGEYKLSLSTGMFIAAYTFILRLDFSATLLRIVE